VFLLLFSFFLKSEKLERKCAGAFLALTKA